MGLMIDVGGGAAQLGAGLGAGFAKGVDDGMAQAREDQIREEAKAEKQALADDMVQAISQSFVNDADAVRDEIPEFGAQSNPGTASIGPAGLPMYLNPGKNPDLEGHDEWVAQHLRVLKGHKTKEGAEAYKGSLTKELDRTIRARATKRFNGTISASLKSGALTQEEANIFLEQLAATGDIASTYNDFNEFRAERVKATNRTRRGMRRIETAGAKADYLQQSPDEWDRKRGEELADLVGQAQVDSEWGDDDFDYDAFEKDYKGILDRKSPGQQHAFDLELEAERQKGRQQQALMLDLLDKQETARERMDEDGAAAYGQQLRELLAGPVEAQDAPASVDGPDPLPDRTGDKGHKQLNAFKRHSGKILSEPETGRKGTISKAKSKEALDSILVEATEKAGIDPEGDIEQQISVARPEVKRILAAVYGQVQERLAKLKQLAESAQFQKEQAERVKQPDKGVQDRARKAGGGGGSPGKPIQAIP